MDRREALKKMAIGGAAAVGTTAVMTSSAFAYSAPSVPVGGSFQCDTSGHNIAQGYGFAKLWVGFTPGTATCPASAKSTAAIVGGTISYTAAASGSGGSFYINFPAGGGFPNVPYGLAPQSGSSGAPVEFYVRKINGADTGFSAPYVPFTVGDVVTGTYRVDYTCQYNGKNKTTTYQYVGTATCVQSGQGGPFVDAVWNKSLSTPVAV